MKAIRYALAIGSVVVFVFLAGCARREAEPATRVAPATTAAQTLCPVMGGEIDRSVFVDHNGRRVYFCCQACVGAFEKDPEKYLAKLDAQMVEPAGTGRVRHEDAHERGHAD